MAVEKRFDFEVDAWGEFAAPPRLCFSYAQEVWADGPVVYLRLGELAGDAANDASGNGRAGTYHGQVMRGQSGALAEGGDGAVGLTGAGGYVSLPGGVLPGGGAARALELWCRMDNSAENQPLFSQGGEQAVHGGKLEWLAGHEQLSVDVGGHVFGVTGLSLAGWNHLVLVLPTVGGWSDQWQFFVNGQRQTGATLSGTPQQVVTANANVYLGRRLGAGELPGAEDFLAGDLDEFAVYGGPLSEPRIIAHHRMGRGL
ncbi:MAG: hypothetical protein IT443_01770 [Phycisphaeraceae bacterium]|nr:hypothetical protein [Phycisphaeraceae bacterium]